MKLGGLAMFDALGFKRIWDKPEVRDNPGKIIEKLRNLERLVQLDAQTVHRDVTVSFLSDTIVVGVVDKEGDPNRSVFEAAKFAGLVAQHAVADVPRLAYRGAVTFGKFLIEDNFIVGPAVDEAAESMDRPQGAFVMMVGEAEKLTRAGPYGRGPLSLIPYAVPLKGGDQYDTFVATPFVQVVEPKLRQSIKGRILETFSAPGVDVAVKRQNTERFLDFAVEWLGR